MAVALCASCTASAKHYYATPGAWTIERALQEMRLDRLQEHSNAADVTQWGRADEADRPVIHLAAGTYALAAPVTLRPEDSGVRLVADGDVRISGGVRVTGWRTEGGRWVADVPQFNGRAVECRQLWVNGQKAVRARDVSDFEQMHRIRSMDKAAETIYVPAEAVKGLSSKGDRPMEMVLHEMWCVAVLRVRDIRLAGDSAAITFHQPESHVHFMHPWPSPMVTPGGEHNSAFYLTGAMSLLDEPGEWHAEGGKIYYMPRPGERPNEVEAIVPALETLLQTKGTPDRPVTGVSVEGITFEHAAWTRPSFCGHAPLQTGMYMTEAYKIRPQISRPNGDHKLDNQGWVGRPAAAVAVSCATNVSFLGCTFRHTASTALDYHTYIYKGAVSRCRFEDIGGSAILAGDFSPEGYEAHLPYNPSDRREVCSELTIDHNRIDDAANEDWGCVGIGAGFVRDICIEHNEISNVSYTGISLGWGWNRQPGCMANNRVHANLIHHYARHMYDTAGIYTLGCQPGTLIDANAVSDIYCPGYAHDPQHWFYLYTDEGSSGITVRDNWCPAEKFLQNANGPGNTWENNGPMVSDSIRAAAGVH